jgi:hypothetical protein
MNKRKIKIELEGYEIERIRSIINAIKDFNTSTHDKAPIDYDIIRELDGADDFFARRLGLYQPSSKDFERNWYADYQWDEEDAD